MKLIEPKKPYKPSKPYLPSPPDEYDYRKNSFQMESRNVYNLLDICEKLNVRFETLDPKELIFELEIDSYYDSSDATVTVTHNTNLKIAKSPHVIDYENKNYQKALKAHAKKVEQYEEKLEKYNNDIKVYNEKKKEYDKQVKEADMAYKLEMFNKLKKELKM